MENGDNYYFQIKYHKCPDRGIVRDNEQSVLTAGWHHSVAWRDVRLNSAFHPGFC